jgi:glycosyltransferase involved in cell wall biosynthesis
MRIVHYLSRMRFEEGGVVRAVLDLCGALAVRGHDVRLLTFDAADVPVPWHDGGRGLPRVTILPGGGARAAIVPGGRLAAAAALGAADVAHLHVPWDPVCVRLAAIARRASVPYVVGIHGMLDDWSMAQKALKKRLFLALAGRRFLEKAGSVLNTAEAERAQSSKWYPRGRGDVLPLIFDIGDYEDLPGPECAREQFAAHFPPDGEPVVLFLSRLHPKKRPDALIESMALLREQGVKCTLLLAGTGEPAYEQGLRELVAKHGLGDRVSFVGFVSGRAKVSLYEASSVSVLPTSQENWGFVLIESLACGTPVITTRGVDIWSELEASGAAVITEQAPEAVASALSGLLGSPDRLEGMRKTGRRWVLDNLNTDHVVARYEELYASL